MLGEDDVALAKFEARLVLDVPSVLGHQGGVMARELPPPHRRVDLGRDDDTCDDDRNTNRPRLIEEPAQVAQCQVDGWV